MDESNGTYHYFKDMYDTYYITNEYSVIEGKYYIKGYIRQSTKQIKCEYCGTIIETNMKHCPHCNAPINTRKENEAQLIHDNKISYGWIEVKHVKNIKYGGKVFSSICLTISIVLCIISFML